MTPEALKRLEEPYPLSRRFTLRLLPAIVLIFLGVIVAVGFSVRRASELSYLDQATRTASSIVTDVSIKSPGSWAILLQGGALGPAEYDDLARSFAAEQQEYRLSGLKVYDLAGRTLYSSLSTQIGQIETGAALKGVVEAGKPAALTHVEPNGTTVYELYVPFRHEGRLAAIFELYEPVTGGFNAALERTIWPVIGILAGLLAGFVLLMLPVVRMAQIAINDRTSVIIEMRRRLERLLSRSAVQAMRSAETVAEQRSGRVFLTLLFSDVRNFTSFCETASAEQAVGVLNTLLSLQVETIERFGGDIDKLLGDGILARFHGADSQQRALSAAMSLQERLKSEHAMLGVGVGIVSGSVILGLLGTSDRQDFTVIGDSVNLAARLCSAASAGEVVADAKTVESARVEGFGPMEALAVKGRTAVVEVRRWHTAV